ncbi:MAG: tRNA1(Val) (adenine(37)-N6)-methyltransferase [Bacteroidales bacterium]
MKKESKAFRFKSFEMFDHQSTMKIGTDSILLASWLNWLGKGHYLDIGCGCGIIALLLSQRFPGSKGMAIDIDADSIHQTQSNIELAQKTLQIDASCIDFKDFAQQSNQKFDLVVSNPPYFHNSLKGPKAKRNQARHNDSLPFDAMVCGVLQTLSPDGKLALILPSFEASVFTEIAEKHGLHLNRKTCLSTRRGKEASRWLMELSFTKMDVQINELCIRNADNTFSEEFIGLTGQFYICFD